MKRPVQSNQGKRSQSTSKLLPISARDPLRTLGNSDYQGRVLACSRQEAFRTMPSIGGDSVIEIQVVSSDVCVCQEEGESDHYPLVIRAAQH